MAAIFDLLQTHSHPSPDVRQVFLRLFIPFLFSFKEKYAQFDCSLVPNLNLKPKVSGLNPTMSYVCPTSNNVCVTIKSNKLIDIWNKLTVK